MEKRPLREQLFERFIANESNADELERLFNFFEHADQSELESLIKAEFDKSAAEFNQADSPRLALIHNELARELFAKPQHPVLKLIRTAKFLKIAAAIVVVSTASLWFTKLLLSAPQVMPGSARAFLNVGEKLDTLGAEKAKVIYQHGGISVRTMPDGTIVYMAVDADSASASKLNTITTPRGGEYKVTLSDGSMVMLNAGSKLTFPMGFRGADRRVYVDGEAFFRVAKDPQKPFIVTVGGNEVKVLGTQFNVSNYPENDGVETTLLEGSVNFSNASGKEVFLKPNQQVLSAYGHLTLKEVSAEDFNAWTKGEFLFNDVPVSVVMQKLARWYNVDVDPQAMPNKNLYIRISRKADIEEVLDVISKATDLEFDLKGNKIVFKE
ncbi:FecR family protein [Pedobacter frigidisoli]|uniref:FecR family protein n=1 Tax=Pedobacter frigidisoli TaxID=2530455 RepID=UPI0029301F76|nr:FecR domain-containing protein [Pedobacter frigidisoli]